MINCGKIFALFCLIFKGFGDENQAFGADCGEYSLIFWEIMIGKRKKI